MTKASLLEFFYRWRGRLVAMAGILLLVLRWGETEAHWVFWAGAAVLLAGIIVRVVAQMHLHYRLRDPVKLTVTGPYSYMRNPIYVGNTLIVCSLCFLSELVWFVPVALLWCTIVYSFVARWEESRLVTKFGPDYETYMQNVPRWIPRLRPWQAPWQPVRKQSFLRYLVPSIVAEMHCLLWPVPFILKEIL